MGEPLVPLSKLTETLTSLYPNHSWSLSVKSIPTLKINDIPFIQIHNHRNDGMMSERLCEAILEHIQKHIGSIISL